MIYKNPKDLLVSELETNEGKTYFCDHADDNSICDACSGRPMNTMRERFDDTFYEEVNSFMGTSFGDSKLDAKLKEFIEQEIKKEREEIVEMLESEKSWHILPKGVPQGEFNKGALKAFEKSINVIKNRT